MKRLFVGNLPLQATEAELEQWFAAAGVNVQSVAIIHDRFSGQPRGFGFVEVAETDAHRLVTACNGKEFQGRTLLIDHIRPVEDGASSKPSTSRKSTRSRTRQP